MKRLFYKTAKENGAVISEYKTERSPEGCQMYFIKGTNKKGFEFDFWDSYWVGCVFELKIELVNLFKEQCLKD